MDIKQLFTSSNFFLIAGPCVVENQKTCFKIAEYLKRISEELRIPFVFKSSYRKANRTSLGSFSGVGDEKALKILSNVKKEFDVFITTDIHETAEISMVSEIADIIQIPAFLCRQTSLIVEAARTQKLVNIKKGQFMSAEAMRFAVKKVKSVSQNEVMLTERGNCFGYQDLVVDFRNILIMKSFCDAVILDCTHALQRPNQSRGTTGGQPEFVESLAKAGIAIGANGLFIETHPSPQNALSDSSNMIALDKMKVILQKCLDIHHANNT